MHVEARTSDAAALLDHRWLVLSTILLATGIFGLPILWRSQAFSLPSKIFWSGVAAIETLIWYAGLIYLLQFSTQIYTLTWGG